MTHRLITLLSFGLIGGCGGSSSNSGQSEVNIRFTNVTNQAGLSYAHGFIRGGPSGEPQLISGGVAAGDYDKDGWVDLYVVRGNIGPNLLDGKTTVLENISPNQFLEIDHPDL